jgi:ATP-dependent DNA helicase RecQ
MRITDWLSVDPVSFDHAKRENALKVDKEIFGFLISKLKVHHPIYFKNALGLKMRIEFKGYDRPVQAIIPYSNQPVEFYKWWNENQCSVRLTIEEKIKLFERVYFEKSSVLNAQHKQLINKK